MYIFYKLQKILSSNQHYSNARDNFQLFKTHFTKSSVVYVATACLAWNSQSCWLRAGKHVRSIQRYFASLTHARGGDHSRVFLQHDIVVFVIKQNAYRFQSIGSAARIGALALLGQVREGLDKGVVRKLRVRVVARAFAKVRVVAFRRDDLIVQADLLEIDVKSLQVTMPFPPFLPLVRGPSCTAGPRGNILRGNYLRGHYLRGYHIRGEQLLGERRDELLRVHETQQVRPLAAVPVHPHNSKVVRIHFVTTQGADDEPKTVVGQRIHGPLLHCTCDVEG